MKQTIDEVNLDRLFVELFPAYASILNVMPEKGNMTKKEFITRLKDTYDTVKNPRNALFLMATEKSLFTTVMRTNSIAVFNEIETQ